MLQIQNYLATSSSFIQQVTQAAILVALIRLGSFLLSADGRMDKQPHKLLDMVTVGGCVLAGLIAATAFALSCSALSWLDHEAHPHEVDVQILAYYRIAFTYLVVIFAFAFAAMVYATVVGVCVQSSFRNKVCDQGLTTLQITNVPAGVLVSINKLCAVVDIDHVQPRLVQRVQRPER